jgi:hypothetical protein
VRKLLDSALRSGRRDRFRRSPGRRVVDDRVRVAGHIDLEIPQNPHEPFAIDCRQPELPCLDVSEGLSDQIQCPLDSAVTLLHGSAVGAGD